MSWRSKACMGIWLHMHLGLYTASREGINMHWVQTLGIRANAARIARSHGFG